MSTDQATRVHIFAYQVGFGDCFLIRIVYKSEAMRHMLIDFGTMGMPRGSATSERMVVIAQDIAEKCSGKLDVVVATHRHADHISGFARNASGTGSGDIIRELKPQIVVQPWTEDLNLPEDATQPLNSPLKGARQAHLTLNKMNDLAGSVVDLVARSQQGLHKHVVDKLSFLGEDNVKNLSAVKNLSEMGSRNVYTYFGDRQAFGDVLPGVKTQVLGPPTVAQTSTIKKQRSKDADEFWHIRRAVAGNEAAAAAGEDEPFPNAEMRRGTKLPMGTRWVAWRARATRATQLLGIVTMLDKAMNNTSLILLFEIGSKKLLFPGDAQIENWSYALSFEAVRKQLESIDVYKVGHHGSLNATPKSLWAAFDKKGNSSRKDRLTTVLSTMPGKHGDETRRTEVPRATLVEELTAHSHLHSTQDMPSGALFTEVVLDVT